MKPSQTTSALTRRRMLDVMAAGGLAALLGGVPFRAEADDTDLVRIGYIPITDATPLLVAHAMGFFEEEGLKVAQPTLVKGWETLVRGFSEGHFNLVHLLKPIPVWMRYHNHFPVKILAWAHTGGSAIVVDGNSAIKEFADFSAKRVAIPYWYSMHNIVLQAGLRKAGIRPVMDTSDAVPQGACALKVIAPPLMVKALATGSIDGYTVAEPFNALGEVMSQNKIFRFTGDIWRDHPCCVVCMHEQDTQKKPQWTQKIINAVVKASLHASTHKEETARMLSQEGKGYLPVPAKVVERAMTFYDPTAYHSPHAIRQESWHSQRIGFNPFPYPSATRMIVELMNQTLVDGDKTFLTRATPDFVIKDLVDASFVQKAISKHPQWHKLPGLSLDHPFEREETFIV
ncbi:MAG: ABC transporter substrate-binding protein [Magnetococcales bacterium]|nr:ABC transporter substrate-binding protein [Magnetococcales bacterium]